MAWLHNVAIGIDQLLNAVVGGEPDETLSSHAWRLRHRRAWVCRWIDRLFFWQDAHCYQSYLSELERRQMPQEFQTTKV